MKTRRDRWAGPLSGIVSVCTISLLLSGCVVIILSGPVEITPGDFATFELHLDNSLGGGLSDVTLILVAEVPEGWDLISSEFAGTVNGSPVSGSGVVSLSSYCEASFGPARPGMKQISITAGPYAATNEFDEGTATLQFHAAQQPPGEFKIAFAFGGGDESPGDETCGGATYQTINRDERLLSFVQVLFDEQDVPTLELANAVGVTPDGQLVVATAIVDDALNLFERDANSGALTFIESFTDNEGGVDGLALPVALKISPEGRHIFVAGNNDNAIATFKLEEGSLSFESAVFNGVGGVTGLTGLEDLALFGEYLYAGTISGITVFRRDFVSGELALLQELDIPIDLSGFSIAVSPDGRHLYAADATTSIWILEIEPTTGLVSVVDEYFGPGPQGLTISPDGRNLYAFREAENLLFVFERSSISGLLTAVETYNTRSDLGAFISSPTAVTLSPAGDIVFLAGRNSVSAFARQTDGRLRLLDFEIEGDGPVTGVPHVLSLALSPGGEHVYSASRGAFGENSGSVVAFVAGPAVLFTDGFESGDTTVWSATVP